MNHGTVEAQFQAALARFPKTRVALVADEQPVTWGELALGVDRLEAGLRQAGVTRGSVVGYSLPNCPEALTLFLALARLGALAMPLFPMMPDPVRCAAFRSGRAQRVVVPQSARPGLEAAAALDPSQPLQFLELEALIGSADAASGDLPSDPEAVPPESALLLTTSSGTTGIPKGVLLTQRHVAASLAASGDMTRFGPWAEQPDYTVALAFPLSTSGVMVILGLLFAGVRGVFSHDLSPSRFCAIAAQAQVNVLSGPPAFLEALLQLPVALTDPLRNVNAVQTGMDFLSPSLLTRLRERFPGLAHATNGYGLVETSTVFMIWKASGAGELASSDGQFSLCPSVDNQIDVRDESQAPVCEGEVGELWAKGPSVITHYLGRPSQEDTCFVDGWFRTGDVVRRGPQGTVQLLGRRKYLIKRGGKSVSPLEVEVSIGAHPSVLRTAVVGVPHSLYGEMIWAFVVAKPGKAPSLSEIMRHCRSSLPSHMVPDQISFIDKIPEGRGVGKVDRETLRRDALAVLATLAGA